MNSPCLYSFCLSIYIVNTQQQLVWKNIKIMVSPLVKQSWIVIAVLLNNFCQGLILSYPYCLLPALKANDSAIKVDLNTASWLVSCAGITMLMGPYLTIFLMKYFGRRFSHGFMVIPSTLGWLCTYFATNVTMLTAGRLCLGLSSSIGHASGNILVGEYTSPEYRGLFLNLKTAFFSLGSAFIHLMSAYFDWRTVALVCLIPVLLSFFMTCTWTESPSWLASKQRFKESREAFIWLRGADEKSMKEFEALVRSQRQQTTVTSTNRTWRDKCTIFAKIFLTKDFVKPVVLVVIGFTLLCSSGRHYFPVYAADIIGAMIKDSTNLYLYTVCIDITFIISTSVSNPFVKMLPRRTMLFFSAIVSIFLLLVISVYIFLVSSGMLLVDSPWIPTALLVVYFVFANFGCTAIPMILFGELLPLRHKEIGLAVASTFTTIGMSLYLKYLPLLFFYIQVYGAFTFCATIMTVCLIYLYFFLPETRNRTMPEIEDFFKHGKFLDEDTKGKHEEDVLL